MLHIWYDCTYIGLCIQNTRDPCIHQTIQSSHRFLWFPEFSQVSVDIFEINVDTRCKQQFVKPTTWATERPWEKRAVLRSTIRGATASEMNGFTPDTQHILTLTQGQVTQLELVTQ